jgi:hypothetical protein
MAMINDLPLQYRHDEMELNAYNAVFYELGFRWHWDRDTYFGLLRRSTDAAERIRHYLETHQPHVLKAYDAAFLVELIQQKKVEHRKRGDVSETRAPSHFDWSQTLGRELGA